MQILQTPQFSTLRPPKPAISKTLHKPSTSNFNLSPFILYHLSSNNRISLKNRFTAKSSFYASDEVPVDEEFLKRFGPKEVESPEQARRRDWVERGWAPWEEILTPEADFARKSLDEGFEVPLKSPEAIEAFKMLRPSYVKKKIEEMGITEDEFYERQFEIKGEMLDPLETYWDGPLVVSHVAPRDWPPKGWEVDSKELEFIREAHKTISERVSLEDVENAADGGSEGQNICLERYDVFLKQYYDWVEHNKDRLEEESYKYDQDYHPGRRKRGKDYKEGMYELPFYYPGQICVGTVTTLHLYQGAFVDIGGVYEGWVPIQGNDWFWIRQYIKVGMRVTVEVMAKRDPYRFRFPIELRFVDPNIDHMIFRRFEFPPIFHRDEDNSPDELRRDCGRPPIPRRDPEIKWEEEPLLCNHPYVDKLWQIHVAEQMILDDMEANPEKYEGKVLSELTDEEDFDEKNSVEYGKVRYKKTIMPRVTLKQSVGELDLEAALAERQLNNKLEKEAEARGEELKISMLRRNHEMNEYDYMHWRRSVEEREALIRDISSRKALGLPLEEPGRYVDQSFFGEQYDPSNPVYRYDYWGEPKSSDKSKKERIIDAHNKAIVGKGTVLNEMSYEEAIKLQEEKENLAKEEARRRQEDEKNKQERMQQDDADEEYEWDDFDFSLLDDVDDSNSIVDTDASQPHVNGTQSSRISDEGIFED